MKIYRLSEVQYVRTDPEGLDDLGDDRVKNRQYDDAADVFHQCKIRPSRGKDLSYLATIDGKVVGSVFSEWSGSEFSFDVAVLPQFHSLQIGPKLIEKAIQMFEGDAPCYVDMGMTPIMRVDCINIKLSQFLIKHYGFKVVVRLEDRVVVEKGYTK